MRQVLSTSDRSLVESLLIALEAEGIGAIFNNEFGSSLPFMPVTVAVVDDADYQQALAVLHSLQHIPRRSVEAFPWFWRLWRLVFVALLVLVLALCFHTICCQMS